MEIKINTSSSTGLLLISNEANITEAMEVITAALLAEGYNIASIKSGFETMAERIKNVVG